MKTFAQFVAEANKTRVLAPLGGVAGSVEVKPERRGGFLGIGGKTVNVPVPGTWTRSTPGREALGPRSFDAYGSGSKGAEAEMGDSCLLYTSPSPRDATLSRMPSSA